MVEENLAYKSAYSIYRELMKLGYTLESADDWTVGRLVCL